MAKVVLLVLPLVLLLVPARSAFVAAQSIAVPYRGRDYSVVSRDGLTVMVAPMDLSILNYSAAHVWVTNGSKRSIRVGPQMFTVTARNTRSTQPRQFAALSDGFVVEQAMRRARFGDILSLVRAYERNLYGFQNSQAIGYYQKRKQIASAEGTRKLRAGAMVSVLVLQAGEVPAGEFREGTVFFDTGDRKSELLGFTALVNGQSMLFRNPAGGGNAAP